MIRGLGIDSVEISRFTSWAEFPHEKLSRLFSEREIYYCLENPTKSAERFAARFAVREAFFKALAQLAPGNEIPFLSLCKMVKVESTPKAAPQLIVNWPAIEEKTQKNHQNLHCWLSITHTSTTATVMVIIENKE